MSLSGFVFGYLPPLLGLHPDLNTLNYAALAVKYSSVALFAAGFVSGPPARFTRATMFSTIAIFGVGSVLLIALSPLLPTLISDNVTFPPVTSAHMILSLPPLLLVIAVVGEILRLRQTERIGNWLLIAMLLHAGSLLHGMFLPYGPNVSSVDVLILLFGAVTVVGGVTELHYIADERTTLLAREQEQTRRLTELAVLKADFTAMVAHELGNPVAAVRTLAEALVLPTISPPARRNGCTDSSRSTDARHADRRRSSRRHR